MDIKNKGYYKEIRRCESFQFYVITKMTGPLVLLRGKRTKGYSLNKNLSQESEESEEEDFGKNEKILNRANFFTLKESVKETGIKP